MPWSRCGVGGNRAHTGYSAVSEARWARTTGVALAPTLRRKLENASKEVGIEDGLEFDCFLWHIPNHSVWWRSSGTQGSQGTFPKPAVVRKGTRRSGRRKILGPAILRNGCGKRGKGVLVLPARLAFSRCRQLFIGTEFR